MQFLTARTLRAAVPMALGVTTLLMAPRLSGQPIPKGAIKVTGAPPSGSPPLPKAPPTPKIPTTFEGLFAARNDRAVDALHYFQCMSAVIAAVRSGELGNVPREWSTTCVNQRGEWRGVFGQLTEIGIDIKLQIAVRAGKIVRVTDRVDTARVSGAARALLRGLASPVPGKGAFELTPVPLPEDKFIEVWFLPVPNDPAHAIVGGDSLIQMSADGKRELGHGKSATPIRASTLTPDSKTITILSLEERIPAVSELLLAHLALDVAPEVRITTHQYTSVLTRNAQTGATRWTHRPFK